MKAKDRWPWHIAWDWLTKAVCPLCSSRSVPTGRWWGKYGPFWNWWGKYSGGKETGRKEISSRTDLYNEDVPVKNAKGETIGTTRALVLRTTVTFLVHYRCYFEDCRHEWDAVEKRTD